MRAQNNGQSGEGIVLPLEMVAKRPATLAVFDATGHVAAGVEIVLSDGETVTTDESGRAHFLAPPDAGVMFARIVDSQIRDAADVLEQRVSPSVPDLQISAAPKIASLKERIAIRGRGFQGDADQNRVTLDGRPALILASSPVELIIAPPVNLAPGSARLILREGKEKVTREIAFVQVSSSISSSAKIQRGRKFKMVLRVNGTAEPVQLNVTNMSPGTVQFSKKEQIRVRTSGGADNSARITAKGIGVGAFWYSAKLVSGTGEANLPVARDFLEAARKAGSDDLEKRIRKILRKLKTAKTAGDAQVELRKLQGRAGVSGLQALIQAVRRALCGK